MCIHTHYALDDAICTGYEYLKLKNVIEQQKKKIYKPIYYVLGVVLLITFAEFKNY